jgi:hypothetical protein
MIRMILTSSNSVIDRLIRFDCIGGSVYVHRHLISERSYEWKTVLASTEEQFDAGLSIIDTKVRWRDPMGGKRRWQLYIGFLYGNPIWTRSDEHSLEDDFLQLAILWDDCRFNDQDTDAADAAMDAMREIVTHNADALRNPCELLGKADALEDGDAPLEFIMDFMVFGRSEDVFGKWYRAFNSSMYSCIDQELSERFAEKAELRRNGKDMPDLMERCRYHLHRDMGEHECYLDK